jgi:LysM repeat protein
MLIAAFTSSGISCRSWNEVAGKNKTPQGQAQGAYYDTTPYGQAQGAGQGSDRVQVTPQGSYGSPVYGNQTNGQAGYTYQEPGYSSSSAGYTSPAPAYTPPPPSYSAPDPAPSYTGGGQTHTVERGDTLYSISRRYGTSVNNIMSQNGLNTDIIRPGEVLRVQ